MQKFKVPPVFVDSPDPAPVVGPLPGKSFEMKLGWPVIVLRGKHAGKTGRILVIERWFVRIVEDSTNCEVRYSYPTVEYY